jgi:hypothetical protein
MAQADGQEFDTAVVVQTGLAALTGALTACGPVGGALAFLGGTLAGVLSKYGGSSTAPSPYLTGGQVEQIITLNLLKQDVRDGWSLISSAYDWYRDWTVRAKRGEVFTPADLAEFDHGYASFMGPNSAMRQGLTKLYSEPANLASTPGQYGVPYLILGVGVWVQLLEIGIARTAERGETVSPGEWENFMFYLQHWMGGITTCDRLASYRVEEAVQDKRKRDPSIKPGSPALANLLRKLEIVYHGGASADRELPALTATKKIVGIQLALEAAGHALAPP